MSLFLGENDWRELNDRGMNFIPTAGDTKHSGNALRSWHPDFWSGFARRGTVVPGGECVKKTARICKFLATFKVPVPGVSAMLLRSIPLSPAPTGGSSPGAEFLLCGTGTITRD